VREAKSKLSVYLSIPAYISGVSMWIWEAAMRLFDNLGRYRGALILLFVLPTVVPLGAPLLLAKGAVPLMSQLVDYEIAQKVAGHYARVRWEDATVGPGEIYYAPDGKPEVYFFIVFRKGTPKESVTGLLHRIRVLRRQRMYCEKALESAQPEEAKRLQTQVSTLWGQMSASDRYGTVVVGAHEEREPFVASYNGLPPHIFLREDAVDKRRQQIGGKSPWEPRYIWQPPLFVGFEFPAAEGESRGVFFEVRGVDLQQVSTGSWERMPIPERLLQQRKRKWQAWGGASSEK